MQDLLVGPVGLLEDLADLLLDLGGGAGSFSNVLDQIARILQEGFDMGYIGEINFATLGRRWDGQLTRFLDQATRFDDPF